ncbi:hypothetical protein ACFOOM_12280 [Streptomyces echinoruber]|uniref:Uncharacterized protein n=1 Tax=Streptomyces echinoruber TaxID=68898 RepID=A0A918RL40_9ACTN|nr:hypothetical protein [Streptomyces echinoruber]GHA01275.1 hypothetical protein GCM10010389_45770 [Streptomyces echinoruber]
MNYRPYPDADRALRQLQRGRVPEPPQPPIITSFAQFQAYVKSGEFARRMQALNETISAILNRRAGGGEIITPDVLAEQQPIVLARVVRTCVAVPSQWNAWTTTGQYLYLRYRSGIGTVDAYDNPDSETWTRTPDGAVARFDTGDRLDGEMTIEEFCERAGLELAVAEVTGEPQDNMQEHDTEAWDVPDARPGTTDHTLTQRAEPHDDAEVTGE